jgi:hypothetical protein
MHLENFTLNDDNIGLDFGSEYYDLHNCADFVGFSFDLLNRKATFVWKRSEGEWVPKAFPTSLTLEFKETVFLKVIERNLDADFTDDTCLEYMGFHPQELLPEPKPVQVPNSHLMKKNHHFVFHFESGLSFRLLSKTVSIVLK